MSKWQDSKRAILFGHIPKGRCLARRACCVQLAGIPFGKACQGQGRRKSAPKSKSTIARQSYHASSNIWHNEIAFTPIPNIRTHLLLFYAINSNFIHIWLLETYKITVVFNHIPCICFLKCNSKLLTEFASSQENETRSKILSLNNSIKILKARSY